jgi:hypothetical protein
MNYAFLTHAQLKGTVETKNNIGTISSGSNFEVDWETGHFQTVSITTTAGMTFANWPSSSSVWSRLRLQITATTLSNLTISGTYIENLQNIQGASGNVLTLNTGVYQFDFSSLDAGAHAWIEDALRNYDAAIDFSQLNVTGNVLSTGLSVFGNARIGSLATPGAEHTIIGNVSVTGAGTEYFNIAGNILAVQASFGSINSTGLINTTGNVLAASVTTGALINNGNTIVGLAGVSGGQFHTVVGNITQTSSGGAVYINTTGNVLAASVTTGALINNGNIIIADPIGAGSFGSNLTVKGTVEFKSQDQSNNASVNTSTKSLTLAPGGDQFLLININGNCSIGYNATITPGHQTTVHVKNSAGALAYVIVPNANTNTGNAFIGLATGITGTFVFTSYGTDDGNVFVTVSR